MTTTASQKEHDTPDTPDALSAYAGHYSPARLWDKLRRHAKRAGYDVLEKALWLYYAAESPRTPTWARTAAYGALGYLILPMDAIPDWLGGVGFTDDLGVLTMAVTTIISYIDDDVRARASCKLTQWFGPKPATREDAT